MGEPDRHDVGFVCKACGRLYADKDVKHWDGTWTGPAEDGERTLIEIIHQCPSCGDTYSYVPNEATFRGLSEDKR